MGQGINTIERESFRKLSEYRILTNRLRRYWKKLVKEGLNAARSKGLAVVVHEGPYIPEQNSVDIFVTNKGTDNEFLYEDNLLKLAKPAFPSLYRRYYKGLEREEYIRTKLLEIKSTLEGILNDCLL